MRQKIGGAIVVWGLCAVFVVGMVEAQTRQAAPVESVACGRPAMTDAEILQLEVTAGSAAEMGFRIDDEYVTAQVRELRNKGAESVIASFRKQETLQTWEERLEAKKELAGKLSPIYAELEKLVAGGNVVAGEEATVAIVELAFYSVDFERISRNANSILNGAVVSKHAKARLYYYLMASIEGGRNVEVFAGAMNAMDKEVPFAVKKEFSSYATARSVRREACQAFVRARFEEDCYLRAKSQGSVLEAETAERDRNTLLARGAEMSKYMMK